MFKPGSCEYMKPFSPRGEINCHCRKDAFQLHVQQNFAYETVKASPPPQVKWCTPSLFGHQPVNPPELGASAQCNRELTSDSQQMYYWVMYPQLPINARWTLGNSLLRWLHEYRNHMGYAYVADSQVYFKWVRFICIHWKTQKVAFLLLLNSQFKKCNGCLKYTLMLSGIKKKKVLLL